MNTREFSASFYPLRSYLGKSFGRARGGGHGKVNNDEVVLLVSGGCRSSDLVLVRGWGAPRGAKLCAGYPDQVFFRRFRSIERCFFFAEATTKGMWRPKSRNIEHFSLLRVLLLRLAHYFSLFFLLVAGSCIWPMSNFMLTSVHTPEWLR